MIGSLCECQQSEQIHPITCRIVHSFDPSDRDATWPGREDIETLLGRRRGHRDATWPGGEDIETLLGQEERTSTKSTELCMQKSNAEEEEIIGESKSIVKLMNFTSLLTTT
jgi:hypothetical protein